MLVEILLIKVWREKCDLLFGLDINGQVDRPNPYNSGPIDRPDFHNYVLIEILLKKVRLRKCDPLGPIDRPDFHNFILIEILLKKVRLTKCDPLENWHTRLSQLCINRNFAQKSAT